MVDPTSSPDAVTALQLALVETVRLIIMALAPILVGAMTAVAVQVFRRFGLEIDAQKQARLEHFATLAIQEAEEWAARRVTTQTGIVVQGVEKLERAVSSLLDLIPGITRDEATTIVHARLPQVGIGAAAALGEVTRAAVNETR